MKWWKIVLLALASVVMLSLGWLRATGLPLLAALVPMLIISESFLQGRRSSWKVFGIGFATFGTWAAITAWWIWYAAPVGAIAAVIIQGTLSGGALALYHKALKLTRRTVAYTIFISAWIFGEYIYLNGALSFPWLMLGNGFANDVWAVQWYEFTGVFGGTLWVLLANVLIFECIRRRTRSKLLWAKITVLVPVMVSLFIFAFYTSSLDGAVKVTVVQPNFDPYTEKFTLPQDTQNDIIFALARTAPEDVDYIVVPETAFEDNITENYFSASPTIEAIRSLMREYPNAQFIAGATTIKLYDGQKTKTAREDWGQWYDYFNTALAIDTTGVVGVHHKSKLVVGVETMPSWWILRPFEKYIIDLGGTTGQLGTDDTRHTFRHSGHLQTTTAAQVCYESVYGENFAAFAREARLMFVITNDGWWHNTEGYRQHFSFSRLRAIETRRAIARSANTGISGFISPRGDVWQTLGWDRRDTLTETLPLNSTVTLYARWGDYIGRIGALLFLLGLGYLVVAKSKQLKSKQ